MMNIHSKMFQKIKDKKYRNLFIKGQIKTGIPFQVRALRAARKLTQGELAELARTKQSVISRIENRSENNLSIKTLLNLAEALDVALVVRFEPIDKLVHWVDNQSLETMSPKTSDEILSEAERIALEGKAAIESAVPVRNLRGLNSSVGTIAVQGSLVFDTPQLTVNNTKTATPTQSLSAEQGTSARPLFKTAAA